MSPAKRPSTPSDARARILTAARGLFAEHGYSGASISMIAKRAGVLSGSIYWAFPSKEDLFVAALTESAHEWRAKFTPDLDAGKTTLANFLDNLSLFAVGFAEGPEFVRLLMVVATEHSAGAPEIKRAALEVRRSWRDLIEAVLLAELSEYDEDAARALVQRISRLTLQFLDGTFMSIQLEEDQASPESLIAEVAGVIQREFFLGVSQLARRVSPGQAAQRPNVNP